MRNAHVGTHTEDKISFQRRSRIVRHGLKEGLGAAQLFQEWQCKTVQLLLTDSQSVLAVCKQRGPGRMKHLKLKMLTVQEWLKTGTLRIHKVSTHDNPADFITKP